MHLLPFVVIIKTVTAYLWLKDNDRYDCVASVNIDGHPASTGVFINTLTVLTSANPLNKIGDDTSKVLIHAIDNMYNESRGIPVESIANDQSYRKDRWVSMGIDGNQSSIHDLALITIKDPIFPLLDRRFFWPKSPKNINRRPYPVSLPNITHYKLPNEFAYAGFGYLDDEHVRNSTELEVTYIAADLMRDCDEWIPREWGRFLCFLDLQKEFALASGSPLFENDNMEFVYGIGCFTLRKGKENVHVFTDLMPYVNKLYGI